MNKKIDYIFLLKVLLILIFTTVAAMFLFAIIMYFLEGGYEFSPLFATLSLGVGCLVSSFFASKKIGQKGYIIGAVIGAVSFIIVTLIGLMASKDIFTLNTLFRLIILMLSSLIGGVLGVNNKGNQKYI